MREPLNVQAAWEIRWLLQEKYGGEMTKQAKDDIRRLERGEPVDYVIGWVDFLGCRIDLSARPFIPRPETEYWVGKTIEDIQAAGTKKAIRCLDVFAGSGCIGMALLCHLPHALIDFAEKEGAELRQIEMNVKLNGIGGSRYQMIQSDVCSSLERGRNYDYIFANPPYIAQKRKRSAQKSVLEWEPDAALFGKADGLYYITILLEEAKNYLAKEGKMYIEFDSPQKAQITSLLRHYGYAKTRFSKDQYGRWRWVEASY